MSETGYVLSMTVMLSLLIIVTRALPFMISRFIKDNTIIRTLGRCLPAYIMVLLVVFEIDIPTFKQFPYGIPALSALVAVVAIHCWRHNMILSVTAGTATFIILQHVLFAF